MADAIWNDRYLLSNMTSEKLYAKSPLTTGVSGTSAYIGLEPSATYNETVLFSASQSVSSCTLSEPWSAFDRLKLFVQNNAADGGVNVVEIRPTNNGMYNYAGTWSWDNSNMLWVQIHGSATQTTLTNLKSWGFKNTFEQNAATRSNNANDLQSILEVRGINRKEV